MKGRVFPLPLLVPLKIAAVRERGRTDRQIQRDRGWEWEGGEEEKKARARGGTRNVETRGALLANGTLALRRARGVATLLRAVETPRSPTTSIRAAIRDTRHAPRDIRSEFATCQAARFVPRNLACSQIFYAVSITILWRRRRRRGDRESRM